jgi:hypothetical protein
MSAAVKVIGMWDHGKWKYFPEQMCDTLRKYSCCCLFVSCTGSLEPPEIALMMLTIPIISELLESGASCFGGGGGGGWA